MKYDIKSKIMVFEIFDKNKLSNNQCINYIYNDLFYFELKYLYSLIF